MIGIWFFEKEECLLHGLNALLSRMLWSAGSRDDCLIQSTIGPWDGQIGRSQHEKNCAHSSREALGRMGLAAKAERVFCAVAEAGIRSEE